MVRYRSSRPDDSAIREHLSALAHERQRFGFRRLGILLQREGIVMNRKKLLRLYREEGLAVRRRKGRRRALGTRASVIVPDRPNQRWSLDFVSNAFMDSRRFCILCVVDDFSRECFALVADTSISGARVARATELDHRQARQTKNHCERQRDRANQHGGCNGHKTGPLTGTTSHRANQHRMLLSRASTSAFAMSV